MLRWSVKPLHLYISTSLLLVLVAGCSKPPKPKLGAAYASGRIQLHFPDRGHFRIDFEPGTPWAQFGPLEGETTEFGSFFALLPKTLDGKTEEQINADALKAASTQGVQTDLMAAGNLMRTVKMEIEEDGRRLAVTDPPANDPDKHPLRGAIFVRGT